MNVRGVPLVRPVKLAVKTFPTVTALPVDGVTVYPVMVEPPFETGAVHETVAELIPATAETPVGASATPEKFAVVVLEIQVAPESVLVYIYSPGIPVTSFVPSELLENAYRCPCPGPVVAFLVIQVTPESVLVEI